MPLLSKSLWDSEGNVTRTSTLHRHRAMAQQHTDTDNSLLLPSSREHGICLVLSLMLGGMLGPGALGFAEATEMQWAGVWFWLACCLRKFPVLLTP